MTIKTTESRDPAAATRLIADHLAGDLGQALDDRDTVVFLASGGRSPRAVLEALAQADLDWSRVIVSLSDERCAPEDHAHCNMAMVKDALSVGPAARARTVALWEAGDTHFAAATRRLNAALAPLIPFDVSLIGMGMDGHTASIFPNGEGMREARTAPGPFVATKPDPLPEEAPWPRITATLPALAQVRAQHLMLFGAEKVNLFKRLIETAPESPSRAPIAALANASGDKLTAHFCA